MSRFYTLRSEQWIERPLNEVFAFFCDPHNLEALTPPWLNFRIVSISTPEIERGTMIRYRLRLRGLPISWTTEILHWDPPHRFVDVQRSGPYRLWHHTHRFEAHGDRTKMMDIVRYALPLGVLGRIAHTLVVRNDVRRIFEYRFRRIQEAFA